MVASIIVVTVNKDNYQKVMCPGRVSGLKLETSRLPFPSHVARRMDLSVVL